MYAKPPKHDTTSELSKVLRDILPKNKEIFVDDITDETWSSIIYYKDDDSFSIYIDARRNGPLYEGSAVTLRIGRETFLAALYEAMSHANDC